MFRTNKIAVIIAAAGSGKRMGSGAPKQFLQIEGLPVLVKTVEAFCRLSSKTRGFVRSGLITLGNRLFGFFEAATDRFARGKPEIVRFFWCRRFAW